MGKGQDWHEISFSSSPDNTITSELLSNIRRSGRGLNSPSPRLIINDRVGLIQHTLWKLALPFHAEQLQTGHLQSINRGRVKIMVQSQVYKSKRMCL